MRRSGHQLFECWTQLLRVWMRGEQGRQRNHVRLEQRRELLDVLRVHIFLRRAPGESWL